MDAFGFVINEAVLAVLLPYGWNQWVGMLLMGIGTIRAFKGLVDREDCE